MTEFAQETRAQLRRWLLRLAREPYSLAFNLVHPVILFIFMGGAFQSLARGFVDADYRAFILPGILALVVLGNSLGGGIALLFDKENGFLTRLMSLPITRASILVGRFLAVNVSTLAQCVMILLLGWLFGVRPVTGVGGGLVLLGIALLLGFGVTMISLVLAFVVESHGDFFAILGVSLLPASFLSSAFIPLSWLPAWMSAVAAWNPLTYAVDGMRLLVLSGWDASALGQIVLALLLFDAAAFGVASVILQRRFS